MKLKLAIFTLAALASTSTATTSRSSHLRTQATDTPTPEPVSVKGSIDDAQSSTGCPCQEEQTDCKCGHVPAMVEHGHFANNDYLTKLDALHDGAKHYEPTLMPHGYFGKGEKKEPKNMPEEKPNMVPPGHFAKVAAALRDVRLAKTFGTVLTQKEGVCQILDRVTQLGRFIYEAETTIETGIAGSGKAITDVLDVVCPLVSVNPSLKTSTVWIFEILTG